MLHPNHTKAVKQDILKNGTREQVIEWLEWNDPNGVYSDSDSIAEGFDPLTLETAREIMADQIEE